MSLFYVERQGWQRWPKTLIMVKKNGHGDERRRYVPERTCRNVHKSKDSGCFECSLCGCNALGHNWQSFHLELEWNYCPNCGAKVVSE